MKAIFDQNVVELIQSGRDYRATLGDRTVEVSIVDAETGRLRLLIDGRSVEAYVTSDGSKRWVTINGQTFLLIRSSGGTKSRQAGHAAGELTAPMPGQIRAISVSEGDSVGQGQTLMLLEAMKMEIRIQAPHEGVVTAILVKAGQTVEREQVLVAVESSSSVA